MRPAGGLSRFDNAKIDIIRDIDKFYEYIFTKFLPPY